MGDSVRFSPKRRHRRGSGKQVIILAGLRNRRHPRHAEPRGKAQELVGRQRQERGVSLGPGLYQFLHSAGKARQGRVMTWDWLSQIIPAGPKLKEFPGCLDDEGRGMLLSGNKGQMVQVWLWIGEFCYQRSASG